MHDFSGSDLYILIWVVFLKPENKYWDPLSMSRSVKVFIRKDMDYKEFSVLRWMEIDKSFQTWLQSF